MWPKGIGCTSCTRRKITLLTGLTLPASELLLVLLHTCTKQRVSFACFCGKLGSVVAYRKILSFLSIQDYWQCNSSDSGSDPVILKENPYSLSYHSVLHEWFENPNLKLWNFWMDEFAFHDLMVTLSNVFPSHCVPERWWQTFPQPTIIKLFFTSEALKAIYITSKYPGIWLWTCLW